jgi:5,6-dimethylbenzimidazole synthase
MMEVPAKDPGLYETIHRRRDVRAQFTGEPIDDAVLHRILSAAHAAPSVGLTQPWDFIVITDPEVKKRFWEHVKEERERFAQSLDEERARLFAGIKIEGILESSISIVVTYDHSRGAPAVLGRYTIEDAGLFSVCLAIENLWLSATAEGLGMGWVSFYREGFLKDLLGIPKSIRPVAWLCLGSVSHLESAPDLERAGWRQRRPLTEALHIDGWGKKAGHTA